MKKLLVFKPFFGKNHSNPGLICFAYAFKRFADKVGGSIPSCDFLFANCGFDANVIADISKPYRSMEIKSSDCGSSVPFDTHTTYVPIAKLHNEYEYIMRLDPDAYLPIQSLRNVVEFLDLHPEVDFISPSNCPREIFPTPDPSAYDMGGWRDATKQRDRKYMPWGYPPQEGDMMVIRTEFFRKVLANYNADSRIRNKICPFHSTDLKFGQICQTLGKNPSDYNIPGHIGARIEGSIQSDFWTHMCASNMNMAGVVDKHSRSFIYADLRDAVHRHDFSKGTCDDVQDKEEMAYPHKLNVVAPFFHSVNGYIMFMLFDLFGNQSLALKDNLIREIKEKQGMFYLGNYAMIKTLTDKSGNTGLISKLNSNMDKLISENGLDRSYVETHVNRVISFYLPLIQDYI